MTDLESTALLTLDGEIVVTADAELEVLARVFDEFADAEAELRSNKRVLHDVISARLDHEGRRSMTIDGFKVETNAPTEKQWDTDELRGVLAELQAEGTISDKKARACLKFEPKPVWIELKTLLTDPRCAERLKHCYTDAPANRYAKVKRA
jgi:hypothetical protein